MTGFLKEKDGLPLQGVGWTDVSGLERVGQTRGRPGKWPRKQQAQGWQTCAERHPQLLKVFLAQEVRRARIETRDPRCRGYVSSKDRMTQVWVTVSASGRVCVRENCEERHEAKAVGQVVRVPVAKQMQKALGESPLMNMSL